MFERYISKVICIVLMLFFATSVGAVDQLPEVMVGQSRISWSLATSNSVVSFNGSGNNVNLGNPNKISSISGSFSVEFWYKFSNPNPATYSSTHPYNWSSVLAKGDGGDGGQDAFLFYIMPFGSATNHSISLRSNGGGADIGNVGIATNISNDTFHHVAYVFDNSTKRITTYFDGVSYNYKDMPSDFYPKLNNPNNIYVGCWIPNGTTYFNGSVDELRIYDRALGSTEVAQNYTGTYDNSSSLKGYWNFNGNYADTSSSPASAGIGNAPFVAGSYGAGETIYGGYSGNEAVLNFGQSGKAVGKSLAPSASFDGTSSYIDAGIAPDITGVGPFTISVWVKRNRTSPNPVKGWTGNEYLVAQGSNFGNYILYIVSSNGSDNDTVGFRTYGSPSETACGPGVSLSFGSTSKIPYNDNIWHNIIVKRNSDGTSGELWIDGQLSGSGTGSAVYIKNYDPPGCTSQAALPTQIGRSGFEDPWNPRGYFQGNISTVRTYIRELNSGEIASLASESSNVPTNGLKGYWKLNDGSGTAAADSSGNNYTATFNGTWSDDGPLIAESNNNELLGFEKDQLKKCADNGLVVNPVRCFTLNANSSGIKVMTGRTYVSGVPITEVAALMYPSKMIAGDAYGSLDNFAFWGRSLHQNTSTPASDAAYKIGYAINDNAQAKWGGAEFNKNDAKIATLKNEAPLLNTSIGADGSWYLQKTTTNPGTPDNLIGTSPGDSAKYPEGKVWYVNGSGLTINNNIMYSGKGTIIINGDLNIADGVSIKPLTSQDRLGFIVLGSGNVTTANNNKIRAAIYCKNIINVNGSNSDFTGSFVANAFGGLGGSNIRFYYDYDFDNAWPPGFRYLNMPHASSK
ncbi:MAG: LamG domain-containing protein [Patescibacteria group bacterium]|nr:LamG domain-containing protein [Patescibacteria group bacterium]